MGMQLDLLGRHRLRRSAGAVWTPEKIIGSLLGWWTMPNVLPQSPDAAAVTKYGNAAGAVGGTAFDLDTANADGFPTISGANPPNWTEHGEAAAYAEFTDPAVGASGFLGVLCKCDTNIAAHIGVVALGSEFGGRHLSLGANFGGASDGFCFDFDNNAADRWTIRLSAAINPADGNWHTLGVHGSGSGGTYTYWYDGSQVAGTVINDGEPTLPEGSWMDDLDAPFSRAIIGQNGDSGGNFNNNTWFGQAREGITTTEDITLAECDQIIAYLQADADALNP